MIDASLPDPIDNNIKIDRENAFLLYATFCGDIVRTAAALGVTATVILQMADEGDWTTQLKPILELKKSSRPGDIERAINRALNFVQAHRARLFIERVLQRLSGMTDNELEEYLLKGTAKDGTAIKKLTTRALADLASALEKAQALTYLALSDTATERVRRKEEDSSGSAGDMHVKIAEAMSRVRASSTPRAQLFDAQISIAQDIVKVSSTPANPNDNDDH